LKTGNGISESKGAAEREERRRMLVVPLGRAPYGPVRLLQLALVDARRGGDLETDVALLLEHEPVFTLGRRGGTDNILVPPERLKQSGVPVVHVERGGDVTYHGPGQLVIYPIMDLPAAGIKVVEFVEGLEEVMIRTALDHGVAAERSSRNRGVWVGERKLGSVGIAVRRGISYHGLALNVNPDLTPFQWIHPCGLHGVDMTSLALEAKKEVTAEAVIPGILRHLADVLEAGVEETPPAFLATRMGAGFPEEARVLLG